MTPRERVLTALARNIPDKVPKMTGFNRTAVERTAPLDPADYFGVEVRSVSFESTRHQEDFSQYLRSLPHDVRIGDLETLATYHEWGYDPSVKSRRRRSPLEEAARIEDLQKYRFPDVTADYRYQDLKEEVDSLRSRGLAVMGRLPHLGGEIFETAWRLRGLHNLLVDFVFNREVACYLLDQIAEIGAHNSAVLAEAGVDIIYLGDDVGMPTGLIISPVMWRELLKQRLSRVIGSARDRKPEVLVVYHSDGYIEPIIPDLIEMRVDALHPVQPDRMDPARLKRLYGDRLAFWGTVGTQTLWAFGRPKDIRREVRTRIETVGQGGGLVISSAYDIEPNVPWDNIRAFFEAVEEFGNYNSL